MNDIKVLFCELTDWLLAAQRGVNYQRSDTSDKLAVLKITNIPIYIVHCKKRLAIFPSPIIPGQGEFG